MAYSFFLSSTAVVLALGDHELAKTFVSLLLARMTMMASVRHQHLSAIFCGQSRWFNSVFGLILSSDADLLKFDCIGVVHFTFCWPLEKYISRLSVFESF